MTTPIIESQIEADQLCRRIARLTEENQTLRELADPAAGPLQLQAESIRLRREAESLRELVPALVPYEGPLPSSLAQLQSLPEPHRRQIAHEQPDHLLKLRQVEQLLRQAAERDQPMPHAAQPNGYL